MKKPMGILIGFICLVSPSGFAMSETQLEQWVRESTGFQDGFYKIDKADQAMECIPKGEFVLRIQKKKADIIVNDRLFFGYMHPSGYTSRSQGDSCQVEHKASKKKNALEILSVTRCEKLSQVSYEKRVLAKRKGGFEMRAFSKDSDDKWQELIYCPYKKTGK